MRSGTASMTPGAGIRRHRGVARLVEGAGCCTTLRGFSRALAQLSLLDEHRSGPADRWPAAERKSGGRRKPGRSGGPVRRVSRVPAVARRATGAGHRRPDRRSAVLSGLGAHLARERTAGVPRGSFCCSAGTRRRTTAPTARPAISTRFTSAFRRVCARQTRLFVAPAQPRPGLYRWAIIEFSWRR